MSKILRKGQIVLVDYSKVSDDVLRDFDYDLTNIHTCQFNWLDGQNKGSISQYEVNKDVDIAPFIATAKLAGIRLSLAKVEKPKQPKPVQQTEYAPDVDFSKLEVEKIEEPKSEEDEESKEAA